MKISKHLLWLPALLAFHLISFCPQQAQTDSRRILQLRKLQQRRHLSRRQFRRDRHRARRLGPEDLPPRSLALPTTPKQPLIQLTQSGHDSEPKWSPDGRWIAFLSERKTSSEKDSDSDDDSDKDSDKEVSQLYVISPTGGEAIPLTQGEEEVHTFSWSADSHTIYFATRNPWTKTQKDDYKKQWKDVVQYRTAERGDTIFALDLATALAHNAAKGHKRRIQTPRRNPISLPAQARSRPPRCASRISSLLPTAAS